LHVAYRPYIECPPSRGDTARCSPRNFFILQPEPNELPFAETVIRFAETVIKTGSPHLQKWWSNLQKRWSESCTKMPFAVFSDQICSFQWSLIITLLWFWAFLALLRTSITSISTLNQALIVNAWLRVVQCMINCPKWGRTGLPNSDLAVECGGMWNDQWNDLGMKPFGMTSNDLVSHIPCKA